MHLILPSYKLSWTVCYLCAALIAPASSHCVLCMLWGCPLMALMSVCVLGAIVLATGYWVGKAGGCLYLCFLLCMFMDVTPGGLSHLCRLLSDALYLMWVFCIHSVFVSPLHTPLFLLYTRYCEEISTIDIVLYSLVLMFQKMVGEILYISQRRKTHQKKLT